MEKTYTSIEAQVEFGLDSMDANRTVEVPLRDLMFVFQTLAELISFFHQPDHYPTLAHVEKFIGDRNAGAFHLLHACYYEKLSAALPQDVKEQMHDGVFDNPNPPYFFAPTDDEFPSP